MDELGTPDMSGNHSKLPSNVAPFYHARQNVYNYDFGQYKLLAHTDEESLKARLI